MGHTQDWQETGLFSDIIINHLSSLEANINLLATAFMDENDQVDEQFQSINLPVLAGCCAACFIQ